MVNLQKKFAFTMIELVFAIVIISVVVISIPRLYSVTSSTMETTIKSEESIYIASVLMKDILANSSYTSVDDMSVTKTNAISFSTINSLKGYKFAYLVSIDVTANAQFGVTSDAKKIIVKIYTQYDDSLITTLEGYKFKNEN